MTTNADVARFVATFPVLATADGGLRRLRGLVLDLGIRGRLLSPSLDSAGGNEGVLSKVAKARRGAERSGGIDPAPALEPINVQDHPHELPIGWEWSRLRDAVLTIQIGPFGSLLHRSDYVNGGTPLVNPAHMTDGRIVPDAKKGVAAETLNRLSTYVLRAGDVVMGRRGEMGKCAIVTSVEDGWLCGTGSLFIRPTRDVLASFVAAWLRSPSVRKRLEGDSVGSTMNNLNLRILNNLVLAVPPLAEQKRIVAKVDELMRLIDELEAKQAKKREVQTRFRVAALEALTKAEGKKEVAGAWEKVAASFHVLFDSASSIGALRNVLSGLAYDGRIIGSAPANHDTVAGVAMTIVDCPHTTPEWTSAGHVCLRTTNFKVGALDLSEVRYVSSETYRERIARLKPQPGDVVYSREGGILGIACVIPSGCGDVCLGQRMMLIRPNPARVASDFLALVLNAPQTIREVRRLTGGTASPHLNVGDVRNFSVPMPPLAEQERIVARIGALLRLCDGLEGKLKSREATSSRLVEAVVAELVA